MLRIYYVILIFSKLWTTMTKFEKSYSAIQLFSLYIDLLFDKSVYKLNFKYNNTTLTKFNKTSYAKFKILNFLKSVSANSHTSKKIKLLLNKIVYQLLLRV